MKEIKFREGTVLSPSKIIGIGRNYSEHIKEMAAERTREPVLFLKPNSALCDIEEPLPLLQDHGQIHHEIELAVCFSKSGSDIPRSEAMDYVAGYGLALDLTLRDIQTKAKKAGLPWAVAKGFDHACPVSDFISKEKVDDVHNLELKLEINGFIRQQGNTAQMLFKLPELIAYVSKFFRIEEGDLLLTGTPSGVGPLLPGDEIQAFIEKIADIKTTCVAK